MKQRRSDTPQRKPRRRWRWHIPPAILHGPETLEGTELLDEVKGAKGLVLWQALRDVTLWSGIEQPADRAGLFAPGAGERRREGVRSIGGSEIDSQLETLTGLLDDPEGATSEAVTGACGEIATWAEENALPATALAFAQAGALASRTNAAAGLRVGKLARKKGEDARAETWFRRTIGLARQAKDWDSYASAFIALGNLYIRRGNLPVARHLHIRALRAARRHSLRNTQAMALHDLFVIAIEMGQVKEATAHARGAFEAYGPRHRRIPVFAHDVAYFWTTQGYFEPALAVFEALFPVLNGAAHQICAVGNIARAAGGVGKREVFSRAQEQMDELLQKEEAREYAARALLDVARGGATLGEWSAAENAARMAQEIAAERQEARVLAVAETILDAVRNERAAEFAVAARAELARDEADALAADLVRSLKEMSAAG